MNTASEQGLESGISVVIPVYHSAPILPQLVPRLESMLRGTGRPFEVILVNDGSRDASWEAILEQGLDRAWLRGINLMRNYGQHNALLCGIRLARYSVTVTMDDDLQHPPEEVPPLLAKLEEGHDVVYGTPLHQQHGLWRDLASQVTKVVLQNAMGADVARNVSAFRVFRTPVREAFSSYRGPFISIDVLLTWGTTRFAALPVRHEPRSVGKSNYTFRKLLTHALNMMTGFSTLPLQLASFIGFGLTLFGILVLAYVVGRYLIQGSVVPGFPFLASVIAIFSGAQLFALGIMGEYLARMHFRMMDRPSYVVREEFHAGPKTASGTTGSQA
ncbi:MAG: glycosyltransferase family 2 protein [Planctomycetes bacterium]|nr:glycosyltransferase family 2 protein [Planctomycetota bacterium]